MGKRHIPENLHRRGKRKSAGAAALAACFVLLVLLIGAVIGRYQRQLHSDGSVRAQNFYFTSNLLDGGTHTLAPGSTEVNFTLGNHADGLRCSEMDISYEVSCKEISGSGATDTTGSTVTVKPGTGTLSENSVEDQEVIISNLKAGRYEITAVGEGGYSKTLKATIVVPPEEGQLYYHTDNSEAEYTLLTLWNEGDKPGTATVKYTGIPDNTNPNMKDWTTGGDAKEVEIEPHESMIFRFFSGTVQVEDATRKTPH